MSFGFSIGDFMILTNLAWTTVENARKACGALDGLTREVSSLHIVLQRLHAEVSKPDSILNSTEDDRRAELGTLARDCRRVLRVLSKVLQKYNRLPEEKRSVTKLWQRVRFGNGEMQDLGIIRTELATYTQAITLFLNLLTMGELGKVGRYMEVHGDELREIKHSLHWVVASNQAKNHDERSILTSYPDDDKAVWKQFRRELIKEGFSSKTLGRYKKTIQEYVLELGDRGVLDEPEIHLAQTVSQAQELDGNINDSLALDVLEIESDEESVENECEMKESNTDDLKILDEADIGVGQTQKPLTAQIQECNRPLGNGAFVIEIATEGLEKARDNDVSHGKTTADTYQWLQTPSGRNYLLERGLKLMFRKRSPQTRTGAFVLPEKLTQNGLPLSSFSRPEDPICPVSDEPWGELGLPLPADELEEAVLRSEDYYEFIILWADESMKGSQVVKKVGEIWVNV